GFKTTSLRAAARNAFNYLQLVLMRQRSTKESRPCPRYQTARTRNGPFAGVLIADLTHALSGPFCTMLLAELGARVVKIERPPAGDVARAFGPLVGGQGAYFANINRGKESIALDIEAHPDRELFREARATCRRGGGELSTRHARAPRPRL